VVRADAVLWGFLGLRMLRGASGWIASEGWTTWSDRGRAEKTATPLRS
jgi:hypothetical protein